jgi:mannitol-1-phosphate 5-dehydrogenase
MSFAKCKYPVESLKIVIFGAGKIGRSFIGQLFGCSGYKIVFIDTDPVIVDGLNTRGSYQVIIKGEKEEEIKVSNVQAISAFERQKVIKAVSTAGILAVSVGKSALEKVIPVIAAGLELRYNQNSDCPLDIIIAENMRDAGDFFREHLAGILPKDYPLEKLVGLIETSIGKMVPIMTRDDLDKDPLMVYAEPYNTLILDRRGFKSPIPDVKGLAPKDNIKAWVDRKAFIHNLGHATAAYFGFSKHTEAIYIFEVLDDAEVYYFTRNVMLQSAEILQAAYPEDFRMNDLEDHIDDLLLRFRNRALQDTIYRVGHDLIRKLGSDDRFMGAVHLAAQIGMPYDKILKAMLYGFYFKAKDEEGNIFMSDLVFMESLAKDFKMTLIKNLRFDPEADNLIIEELRRLYMLNQQQ